MKNIFKLLSFTFIIISTHIFPIEVTGDINIKQKKFLEKECNGIILKDGYFSKMCFYGHQKSPEIMKIGDKDKLEIKNGSSIVKILIIILKGKEPHFAKTIQLTIEENEDENKKIINCYKETISPFLKK